MTATRSARAHRHADPRRERPVQGLESAEASPRTADLERLIRPEEVADAIVWLVGVAPDALTGATVPVDGGLSLWP